MSINGIIKPGKTAQQSMESSAFRIVREFLKTYRNFLLIVIAPTLILAFYYYAIASDQYEARADFIVRRADSSPQSGNFGQLLGISIGNSTSAAEAYLVSDYLLSHDAVARLTKENALIQLFRRSGVDWISRLWFANPTPETVLKFYRKQVSIEQDSETAITHMSVHAFSPQDSETLGKKLLLLGEERVNMINERTYHDQVEHSTRELEQAQAALAKAETELTKFRLQHADIDPTGSGTAKVNMVTTLTASLTAQRARLQAMQGAISPNSPQYRAMLRQVQALESQIASQSTTITGKDSSIATSLGNYEGLTVRREIAARSLAAANTAFEQARAEAQRKQIYLIRVVEVNRPVKSLFPERGKIVLTFLAFMTLAYGIGSLLMAGLREHHV